MLGVLGTVDGTPWEWWTLQDQTPKFADEDKFQDDFVSFAQQKMWTWAVFQQMWVCDTFPRTCTEAFSFVAFSFLPCPRQSSFVMAAVPRKYIWVTNCMQLIWGLNNKTENCSCLATVHTHCMQPRITQGLFMQMLTADSFKCLKFVFVTIKKMGGQSAFMDNHCAE